MRSIRARGAAIFLGLALSSACPAGQLQFMRGDPSADKSVHISDAVFILSYLFIEPDLPLGCSDAADANDDSAIDISDAIAIIVDLFLGSTPAMPPLGIVACDETNDPLSCDSYPDAVECDPIQAIVADHTVADAKPADAAWIEQAKTSFRIFYGHTSHGSQILSGLEAMRSDLFDYNNGPGTLSIAETCCDLGNPDFTTWASVTRAQLTKAGNDRNVVMWSWCGQASWASEENIRSDYLGNMDALEKEFPEVQFIYMTGHLDGSGAGGNLHQRNEQIRTFCRANSKILFDFADIESYDPDGVGYLEKGANDNCDYEDGGETKNWAQEWCARNPGECSTCSCAHSQSLNCDRKARAFWWLMARMAMPSP